MIITRIISGLGNQLFQWATGRALAEKNRTDLRLDISFYESQAFSYAAEFPRPFKLKRLRITAGIASPKELAAAPDFLRLPRRRRRWYSVLQRLRLRRFTPRIREPSFSFHPQVLDAGDDVYLEGYWASEKYFSGIAPIIRAEARLADEKIEALADAVIRQHRRAGSPVIGVQVRKGDVHYLCEILRQPERSPVPLLRREYFLAAMQHFGERVTFLVFSDSAQDLQLCREEFGPAGNISYIAGHDDLTDFAILQRCDHQIISNSTFGWWAAWLNPNRQKTVIAPRGWFAAHSPHQHTLPDLIPAGWLLR